MNKEQFRKLLDEWADVKAVVESGMAQATDKEVRNMKQKLDLLTEQLAQSPFTLSKNGEVNWKSAARRFIDGSLNLLKRTTS